MVAKLQSPAEVRAAIDNLATMPLTHAVPSRVSDYFAIRFIRAMRWVADRCFREKFLHRALVLKLIAPAPAGAGCSMEHWRCTLGADQSRGGAVGLPPSEGTTTPVGHVAPAMPGQCSPAPALVYAEDIRKILFHFKDNQQMQMHLVMSLTKASFIERVVLQCTQACLYLAFVILFGCSRRFGLRMSGYLLEESTVMLTHMVNDMDMEKIRSDVAVPQAALRYWGLGAKGMHAVQSAPPTVSTTTTAHVDGETSETSAGASVSLPATEPLVPRGSAADSEIGLLSLRDVVLLLRADDMRYRDLLHAAANSIDESRDRHPGEQKPRSPFS